MELAIKYKTLPLGYYNDMLKKSKREKVAQTKMATTLCVKAGVSINRMLGLNDIEPFENLLNVNIMVVSSKLGDKFIRVVDNIQRSNVYVYLVETENTQHYHGIASISGFFGYSYFCTGCLKPYKNKGHHKCETTCPVCLNDDCRETDLMSCRSCHRECRSKECFQRHKTQKKVDKRQRGRSIETILPSPCETIYKCTTCRKNLKYADRTPMEHQCGEWTCHSCKQYQLGEHLCYQRASTPNTNNDKKFIFYDFETRQDQTMECEDGYKPNPVRCKKCAGESSKCTKCKLCQNCRQSCCGAYQHIVNFAVAQSSCPQCEKKDLTPDSKCYKCGSRCLRCSFVDDKGKFKKEPCATCGYRERVFKGDDAASQFCSHVMTEHCKNSILVAHNAKSFDLYPVLEVLIEKHSVRPDKILYSGSKIMYMHIAKQLNLTFVDSLNFLPMKLAKIPEAFGLDELAKRYFPHYYNTSTSQGVITEYPKPELYGCDYMASKDRKTFMEWYDSKKGEIFDFQKEMLEYCRSDVDILRRGCLKFREIMLQATGSKTADVSVTGVVDVFDHITVAGVCAGIFRTLFLKEEHEVQVWITNSQEKQWYPFKTEDKEKYVYLNDEWIRTSTLDDHLKLGSTKFVKSPIAIVPSEGYCKKDNYSKSSIQWLEWLMEKQRRQGNPLHIQHALNGGEFRIPGTNYRADGYDGKKIFEFHGCVYHGCQTCYPHDRTTTTHPTTKQSLYELYTLTKKREAELKGLGYKYVCIWEHEFRKQLVEDANMKQFVSQLDVQDRLNPRDSFFGGRTNAIKLHHKAQTDETIEYYDFTSLYPWTNKYCRYPVGHPTIITSDFKDFSEYFGIAKVEILPPRGLYYPILPYTSNGKLKFSLCRTCADNENLTQCSCSDENRSIVGTWCTPELEMAVCKGYRIIKIYEIYHFEETTKYDPASGTGGLFSDYVNTFLKIKQEVSGFSDGCNTEEQKLDYIRQYKENEGIELEYDNIKVNPGLRCLAKLCLNSF